MSRRKKIGLTVGIVLGLAALGIGAWVLRHRGAAGDRAPAAKAAEAAGEVARRVPVNTVEAKTVTFESRLVTSGTLLAKRYALVSARMPGTLDDVFVDEGDPVKAGETKLFQTDSLNLTKAADVARQDLAVAECAVREAEAAQEQVEADYHKAQVDYERYKRLFEQDRAVTKNALEVQESRFLQVEAALKHAKASVELAVNQREKARSRVAIAEKDLQDSLVTAPLSGVVSQRMREPGEMAEAGTPVLRIEDPTLLEVSAYLPSDAYASVTPGETEMRVHVGAADLGVYKVSYKSPTADQKLRTFEVKCLIANPPADVVPGLMVDVAVIAVRREGLGVPFVAVQRRNDKDVVFVVTNGTARAATLVQGLETDGWVEVTQSELKAGDAIVFRGQQLIDDGAAVDVLGEGE